MKHVKKKFIKAVQLPKEVATVLDNSESTTADMNSVMNNLDKYSVLIQMEDNEIIQGFTYSNAGKVFAIAEPNPIVIYFETARVASTRLSSEKVMVFQDLEQPYQTRDNFYKFYSTASITVIFLFNSMEAFVNSLIPDAYKYEKDLGQKTEIRDRFQVQKFVPFDEKVKTIIPQIMGKAFHVEHAHKYATIKRLKDFRDSIMHSKSDEGFPPRYFRNLYTTSLDFDYTEALQHVRDFLNYYEKDLIEDCLCGLDF